MYGGFHSEAVGVGSGYPFRLASLTVIIHIFSPGSVLLTSFFVIAVMHYCDLYARRES